MPTGRFVVRSTVALLAIGFLALFGIVGMTIWLGERAQVYFMEVVDARDTRGTAVELRDALRTAEASQRGYLLTSNEIYLAPYDSAKSSARRQFENLNKRLSRDLQQGPMLQRLTIVINEKLAELDQTISLKTERKDENALALFRTNRGKALMDEANVFLFGIILSADERLTKGVAEQSANAEMLRWASIIGALVIVLVVGLVVVTVARYTQEVRQARDEVHSLNAGLEERVSQRTTDLARARDRAEVLLAEVNHRVANSLALVASFVKLQSNAVKDGAAKDALHETQGRIFAVSLVHKRLYSSGDVRYVALDEYLSGLLEHLQTSMRSEGLGASIRYDLEPMNLSTDASINLGVVLTEWVTNAVKYAYPNRPGEVRVRLRRTTGDKAELVVEDDGVGMEKSRLAAPKGTGLGSRIVKAMADTMKGEIQHAPRPFGTSARLIFSLQPR